MIPLVGEQNNKPKKKRRKGRTKERVISNQSIDNSIEMVASDTVITLKGSVEIVSEFFFTAINSILYQRGESKRRRERVIVVDRPVTGALCLPMLHIV